MELRLLRYFLTVAKEQSFTKAAEQLHITQPTLSRQMAAFEEDLGITLFIRNGKKISLTDEGILLKRRALEILNLEERTLEELKGKEEVVEGTITIGCGEFAAVETLAEICKTYKEKYPLVQIVLHLLLQYAIQSEPADIFLYMFYISSPMSPLPQIHHIQWLSCPLQPLLFLSVPQASFPQD